MSLCISYIIFLLVVHSLPRCVGWRFLFALRLRPQKSQVSPCRWLAHTTDKYLVKIFGECQLTTFDAISCVFFRCCRVYATMNYDAYCSFYPFNLFVFALSLHLCHCRALSVPHVIVEHSCAL